MPAIYDGLLFKTSLEAQWAAFFDLAGWTWRSNPAPVGNWSPDFKVQFLCGHSECSGSHTVLVSVLAVNTPEEAANHPALSHRYNIVGEDAKNHKGVDAGAVFGNSPTVSQFEFGHGSGGGVFDVNSWMSGANELWAKAGAQVS